MPDSTLLIKKYGNRRLYDTEASSYITLEDLSRLIKAGRDVKVVDAKTKEDLTKSVLLQIIAEQEKAQDLLPVSFLKKMIQIGDVSVRDGIRRYLSVSLDTFLAAQRDLENRYRELAGSLLNLNPMMWMMGRPQDQSPLRPEEAGEASLPSSGAAGLLSSGAASLPSSGAASLPSSGAAGLLSSGAASLPSSGAAAVGHAAAPAPSGKNTASPLEHEKRQEQDLHTLKAQVDEIKKLLAKLGK